ncbi:hypothetical protein [Isoptericola sp. b408]|uniref:hypothetical protein n=1 Tax=Isoptericola sp. b408 TaxID=3064653 RepID=UPI002712AA7C|nr:hypothetical protein [Isoptericola sp. b408]MDO8150892.1 hypothetical protein [Isoptericola sp. b408]
MRLVRVELRRLWMRRVTWGGLLLALVVAGLAVVTQVGAAQPPSAQEIAQAEQFYADQVEWWQENGAQETASCREAQAAEPGADYGCDRLDPGSSSSCRRARPSCRTRPPAPRRPAG